MTPRGPATSSLDPGDALPTDQFHAVTQLLLWRLPAGVAGRSVLSLPEGSGIKAALSRARSPALRGVAHRVTNGEVRVSSFPLTAQTESASFALPHHGTGVPS